MENNAGQSEPGYKDTLATAQEIAELLHLANMLIEPAEETLEDVVFHKVKSGSVGFREACTSDFEGNHSTVYIDFYRPEIEDERHGEYPEDILTINFTDSRNQPSILEFNETCPDEDDINTAIEIAADLLMSGKLSELEANILLKVNKFLNGQIYQIEGDHSQVLMPDGSQLSMLKAIARAISTRSSIFLAIKTYDDDVYDSSLTITRYDKPAQEGQEDKFDEHFGTTIEISNAFTDAYIKVSIADNGTAAVCENKEHDMESDFSVPKAHHIAELRRVVEAAFARIHCETIQSEEGLEESDWRAYVYDAFNLFKQKHALPEDAPEGIKQELEEAFLEAKQELVQAFEDNYDLNKGLSNLIVIPYSKLECDADGNLFLDRNGSISLSYKDIHIARLSLGSNGTVLGRRDFVCVAGTHLAPNNMRIDLLMPILIEDEIIKPENN